MYGLKARTVASSKAAPKSVLVAQRRRHMRPFVFHMGPVSLCISCVLLIGLMAVLYLSQLEQGIVANQQLQDVRNKQAAFERQNQDLVHAIAQEQSPAYIAEQAQKMGLGPVDSKNLRVLKVSYLQQISKEDQPIQP